MRRGRYDTALISTHATVPGCIAAGVVDRRSGEIVAVQPRAAAALLDELRDAARLLDVDTDGIEALVAGDPGGGGETIQEVVVDRGEHVVAVLAPRDPAAILLVVVSRAATPLGMVLTRARSALPIITAAHRTDKEESPWHLTPKR